MLNTFPDICRYFSVLDRLMKMYYDRSLADYEISYGQQFYLECISEHPGIAAYEMASFIHVDKATLTKNINKLIELGFVTSVNSEQDKRSKQLYPTEKAESTVKKIKEIHVEFYTALCAEFSPQEIETATGLLGRMTENVGKVIWHRMTAQEQELQKQNHRRNFNHGQE